jgi:5,10-methylenetetrahydromethanopterin reductase
VPRAGVFFLPGWPDERLPAFARAAERDGYDELWLAEDCFEAGGVALAATALALTERIGVGIGLLPAAVRNPAIAAMDLATLARLHPGRVSVGFGHGVERWMRQIGARPQNRLELLAETVDAATRLLGGEQVTVEGRYVRLDGVSLHHPVDTPPPLLIGTTGPKALALAGRLADGFLLPEGSGAAAVRWARGQAGGGTATVYSWLSVDDDGDAAVAAIRPTVERWAASGGYPRLTAIAGLGEDGAAAVDDDVVRSIAIAGDPAQCARALAALWEAGADSVVVQPREGDDAEEQLARFAADVLPRARA